MVTVAELGPMVGHHVMLNTTSGPWLLFSLEQATTADEYGDWEVGDWLATIRTARNDVIHNVERNWATVTCTLAD